MQINSINKVTNFGLKFTDNAKKLVKAGKEQYVHDGTRDVLLDALYEEASVQAVLGLIAPELPIAYSEKEKWKEAQYRQMASYIRYCHSEDELKRILDEANIPFV